MVQITNPWKWGAVLLVFLMVAGIMATRPVTAGPHTNPAGADEFSYLPISLNQGLHPDCRFVEENNYVLMEVESKTSTNPLWDFQTEFPGYTGRGYYTWIGPDYFSQPGEGILSYPIRLTHGGKYNLNIHNLHNHPANDMQNDVWVRMDGGAWIKLFSSVSFVWTWSSAFDDPPRDAFYQNLPAGDHLFEISARSFGMRIDRIALHQDGTDAQNLSLPESPCVYP